MAVNYSNWGWMSSTYRERIYLDITQASQDIANNRTTFKYKIYNNSNNSYGDTGTITWRISDPWNSSRASGTRANTSTTGTHQVKEYAEGTFNIQHNADGTLGSVKFTLHISRTAGNTKSATVDVTLTVPTIPRASSFTLSGSTQTGDDITVTITKAATAFRHRVRWRIGSGNWTDVLTSTSTATSVKFTVPHDAFPNSGSGTITVAVQTYSGSGGTAIGNEQSSTRALTVPESIKPSLTGIDHSEQETAVINAAIGGYVQGKSRLKLTIDGAKAGTGATIKSYQITIDGQTVNAQSATTQVIRSSGTLSAVGTVTDSRNRSTSKPVEITVLPYHEPTLELIGLTRSTSTGVQDPFGTSARLNIKAKVASLNSKNTATYRVRSKVASSSSWTTKTTAGTKIGISESIEHVYSGYAVTDEYQFEIMITDKLGSQTIVNDLLFLSTGGVPFFVGYDDIASSFGKIPSHGKTYNLEVGDKGMRVDGPIIDKNGAELLASIYPVGSIYINVVNTNPGTLFGGTWVAFGAGRTIVGVDTAQTEFNTVQKTGGHKSLQSHTHTITVASGGAHTHTVSGTAASNGAHTHRAAYRNAYAGGDTYSGITTVNSAGWSPNAIESAGAHTHTVSGTAASGGAHSHTATAASSGSGNAQNLQPYITVYMWRRTA